MAPPAAAAVAPPAQNEAQYVPKRLKYRVEEADGTLGKGADEAPTLVIGDRCEKHPPSSYKLSELQKIDLEFLGFSATDNLKSLQPRKNASLRVTPSITASAKNFWTSVPEGSFVRPASPNAFPVMPSWTLRPT